MPDAPFGFSCKTTYTDRGKEETHRCPSLKGRVCACKRKLWKGGAWVPNTLGKETKS